MGIKPGQTIRIGSQWGTVSYLVANAYVIVTLDDYSQRRVRIADVKIVPQAAAQLEEEGPVQTGVPDR